MYFPPSTPSNNDIIEQLMRLETMSYDEQLRVVRVFRRYQLDPKTYELVEWLERPMENYMRYAVEEEFYVDEYILAEELEKIVDEIITARQEGK